MRALALVASLVLAEGGPCDIFASSGAPCVAAHSTVRALFNAYGGRLYQVNRTADGALLDVHARAPGGLADAAAQDAFCGAPSPSPPPPPPPTPVLPPLNSTVSLVPAALPALAFRHCDAQGFATPPDGSADFDFRLVAALNGDAALVSLQSVNFPRFFVAPVATAEPGRLGVVSAPLAADASWAVTPAPGGFTLALPSRGGLVAAVGTNLTGSCAGHYAAPAAGVFLAAAGAPRAVWLLVPPGAPPAPPACTITTIYDQTTRGNDLAVAPPGGAAPHRDRPVDAAGLRVHVGGGDVYAALFEQGNGYRIDETSGVAKGNEEETIYMVTSGTHYNGGCCL
jgi:hypothetical protein